MTRSGGNHLNYQNFIDFASGQDCVLLQDEPLSRHTTFFLGGAADWYVVPRTDAAMEQLASWLQRSDLPFFVLGNGSNILVPDEGYRGVILCCTNRYAQVSVRGNALVASAGASLSRVCYTAYAGGLTGLEFAWGIPGSAGGAAYMNAGAYGGEMKDVISRVWYVEDGRPGCIDRQTCDFSYRHSYFTGKKCVITSVEYQLQPGETALIRAKMDDLLGRRYDKQPLDMPSAGSTFKRPVGGYASALIDECGLRGFKVGGAQVSEKHCGFVVNAGGATCADVLELIRRVQAIVKEKTGIKLEREVKILH